MAKIIIVGDGPGGLSAALFLARNGHEVRVYGDDATAMHYAYLNNYLGLPAISGTDFQIVARSQVTALGVPIVGARVISVSASDAGVSAGVDEDTVNADYLILTEGKNASLAGSLGLASDDDSIVVDRNGRTSIDRVYVVGRSARPNRSQAIISAGDGAAAALDILARETGSDVQDWDTPPKGTDA